MVLTDYQSKYRNQVAQSSYYGRGTILRIQRTFSIPLI
jgi:hypothetical protein